MNTHTTRPTLRSTLRLSAASLPDDFVKRGPINKRPIVNSPGARGILEVAHLTFEGSTSTTTHKHKENVSELMVNLSTDEVFICAKDQTHHTENPATTSVDYISIKSYVPFDIKHFEKKGNKINLKPIELKDHPYYIDGEYATIRTIYENAATFGITEISLLLVASQTSLFIASDTETNVMLVNLNTFEVFIYPKSEDTFISKSSETTKYLLIRNRACFSNKPFCSVNM